MGAYMQRNVGRRTRYRINAPRFIAVIVILCALIVLLYLSSSPLDFHSLYRIKDFSPEELMMYFSVEEDQGVPWYYLAAIDKAEGLLKGEASPERSGQIAIYLLGVTDESEVKNSLKAYRNEPKFLEQVYKEIKKFNKLRSISSGKVFPIAADYSYTYANGYGDPRTYGGERKHEGIDIMCEKGIPIVSVCDGKIIKKGWNTLGGWRLYIRGNDGIYYYYAHLFRYNDDLKEGAHVRMGQLLGYAGDSGYGDEGTTGQFASHLHFGMYEGRDEAAVSPYPFLKYWERNKSQLPGVEPLIPEAVDS